MSLSVFVSLVNLVIKNWIFLKSITTTSDLIVTFPISTLLRHLFGLDLQNHLLILLNKMLNHLPKLLLAQLIPHILNAPDLLLDLDGDEALFLIGLQYFGDSGRARGGLVGGGGQVVWISMMILTVSCRSVILLLPELSVLVLDYCLYLITKVVN